MTPRVILSAAAVVAAFSVGVAAQRAGAFSASRDHPAIGYTEGSTATAVTELMRKIQSGAVKLPFDPANGYLRSLLDALAIPVESQVLVFSETSFQARKISRKNPRAVYFTDRVAVGFVRGGDILEIAAQDPRQGTIFYQLPQSDTAGPRIARSDSCLSCHLSWETLAVPGLQVLTVFPRRSDDEYANGSHIDARSPIGERWGGWYVTGSRVPVHQMGNIELLQPAMPPAGAQPVAAPRSLEGAFDLRGYLTPYSDVVALMVLEHQAHATNLITRAGWEYRVNATDDGVLAPSVQSAVDDLVDYLLFVDEAPLPSPIRGSSGFAEKFAAQGPRDSKGRSLRDLQLDTRLMRYPCSFMIYSPGVEGLPLPVKGAVYGQIAAIVDGRDRRPKFAHLSAADRRAIGEILRETSPATVRHFL